MAGDELPIDLYLAAYTDADAAQQDWDDLRRLAKDNVGCRSTRWCSCGATRRAASTSRTPVRAPTSESAPRSAPSPAAF